MLPAFPVRAATAAHRRRQASDCTAPCRACTFVGLPDSDSNTFYAPTSRSSTNQSSIVDLTERLLLQGQSQPILGYGSSLPPHGKKHAASYLSGPPFVGCGISAMSLPSLKPRGPPPAFLWVFCLASLPMPILRRWPDLTSAHVGPSYFGRALCSPAARSAQCLTYPILPRCHDSLRPVPVSPYAVWATSSIATASLPRSSSRADPSMYDPGRALVARSHTGPGLPLHHVSLRPVQDYLQAARAAPGTPMRQPCPRPPQSQERLRDAC
ncbi:hypothetical protein NDU88_001795 [Pleurodeles waltl]|uniref:Uncharacterized protein n=1 Tax=Pleurodeles waltl TaxID=8319 RepID=A0AAV7Q7W0_PLEWA|nr:hypothetical protein NDU88_001795 [Pleurodeles waltl]